MHFECRTSAVRLIPEVWLEGQNVPGMAAEYGSNVQECKQNAARQLEYLECNTNVPSAAGMFPIGYKMLPNLAFSLVSAQPP